MGVGIGEIISREEEELSSFRGRKIAIDAYNTLYQFLSIIRQRDGSPLKDSKGRVTSHLSGLLYRTGKLIENGIKPLYVFDGEPPEIKKTTLKEREKKREEARKKYEKAMKKGKEKKARKYAQMSSRLEEVMVKSSKSLLDSMGVPYIQAPGEGEAQAAYVVKKGESWAESSQDYDVLLYGAPKLIRNLTITGRRKLPGKDKYVEIKPERIELEKVLEELDIDRKGLIEIGLLVGTDYNDGVKGIGPKTALEEVREGKKAEEIYRENDQEPREDLDEIREIFENPKVEEEYELKWSKPNKGEMINELVEKHDFSKDRVEKVYEKINKSLDQKTSQSHLGEF